LAEYSDRDIVNRIPAKRSPTEPLPLAAAIRACRQGRLTQDELAVKASFGQSTLSQWENGKSTPDLEQLRTIEDACGRPHGWIAVQAGYVDGVTSVAEAIAMTTDLDDRERKILLDAYEGLLNTKH
jgi:transcriptional regulator with XRE-family HTH domain